MGFMDDAKKKVDEVADDMKNTYHEEKGRMEGKKEQAEEDDRKREEEREAEEYESEEMDV